LKKVLKVNPKDNIIVALMDLHAGEIVHLDGADYTLLKDTKAKHKFAAEDFAVGDHIIMYGVIVGKANHPIQKGEVITTENVKHESEEVFKKAKLVGRHQMWINGKIKPFNGYHREDGQVGTKNVWLFFPLVFVKIRISRS
jgi:altronate hydrolase